MSIYNSKEIESSVHDFWSQQKIPEKIVKMDWKKKKFYLLDGPPYVNDKAHVGHVKTTTFKDIWGKFKYMQGYAVWFQPGFDCGGLPIENAVEKKLGIKSKSDIEKLGVKKFIEECEKLAKGNEPVWLELYKKLGAWRGWVKPYLTSDDYYRESGWWTIKKLFEKGLFIEGVRPGFWCSHCETVLAGYEVTDSYKDLEDYSVFVKFHLVGRDESLLVWTTTPWTLPANVLVCVHPEEDYVTIEVDGEKIIIAEQRLSVLDTLEKNYRILKKMKGSDLAGIKYEPLLNIKLQEDIDKNDNVHRIVVSIPIMKRRVSGKVQSKKELDVEEEFGHLVTMDVGSGLVHIAPGHGDVDNRLGKHYNVPEPSPVDEKGMLTEETGPFSGLYVKDANEKIIEYLEDRGSMFYVGRITHAFPLCWRCKTPLLYRMSRQWFLKIDTIREIMLRENSHVKWMPEFARERFHNALQDAPDWAVTRQRYWGIPLPIWTCEKCKSKKVMGSLKELKENAIKVPSRISVSKDVVDKIQIKCGCGSVMQREPDVTDVWFDSGIAPWASLGYPQKNKDLFEKLWKVDLIDESQDQIRGWFYSLMFASAAIFGDRPYEKVCLNGWVLDEKGEKMSKSLGNVVSAERAQEELGSDLLRFYYCYEVAPWDTQKFSLKNAKDLGRTLNILMNAYNYFKTYSHLERNRYELAPEDRWILSRLNSLSIGVTERMESFHLNEAGRAIADFIVNDFSRTYVKLVRDRDDKSVDYTLTTIFEQLLRLMAPITPFVSEYLYNSIFGESVHLQKWPDGLENMIDIGLESDMKIVDEIVNRINAFRKEKSIKLRWPMAKIVINVQLKSGVNEILKNLCNVQEVELGRDEALEKISLDNGEIYVDPTVLKSEALLREFTRAVQSKRKEQGMVVTDRILLFMDSDEIKAHEDRVKEKVGAEKIILGEVKGGFTVEMEDIIINFRIEKVK